MTYMHAYKASHKKSLIVKVNTISCKHITTYYVIPLDV